MILRLSLYLACTFVLFSCAPNEEIEPEKHQPPMSRDLSDGGLPLAIYSEGKDGADILARWNPVFGRMELSDDKGMDLFILEDTVSCATKKREAEDGIFQVAYIIDNDSVIFYKTVLPDAAAVYYHFFASMEINGKHYNFENNPLVEFSENEVKNMVSLVRKIGLSTEEANKSAKP